LPYFIHISKFVRKISAVKVFLSKILVDSVEAAAKIHLSFHCVLLQRVRTLAVRQQNVMLGVMSLRKYLYDNMTGL